MLNISPLGWVVLISLVLYFLSLLYIEWRRW